jgi:hypothetical protein
MTCLILVISIIIIIIRVYINQVPNDTIFNHENANELLTIQSQKIDLDTRTVEQIWQDSDLEGNKKESTYYRFEFPIHRGDSEEQAFSLYFRFYVSCEDGENYLDPRIIFGGYYNITEISEDGAVAKSFSIASGEKVLKFNIFKDEKKEAQDGNTYNMMAFSTSNISDLEQISNSSKISIIITLDEKEYRYNLTKDERKKLKKLVLCYTNLKKQTEK